MYNVHIRFPENWSTNSQGEEIWAKCLLNPGCIHLMLVVLYIYHHPMVHELQENDVCTPKCCQLPPSRLLGMSC
jgi:hypothetical protein